MRRNFVIRGLQFILYYYDKINKKLVNVTNLIQRKQSTKLFIPLAKKTCRKLKDGGQNCLLKSNINYIIMACTYDSNAQRLSSIHTQKQLCDIFELLTYKKLELPFTYSSLKKFTTTTPNPDTNISVVSVVLAFSASAKAHAPSAPTLLFSRLRLGEKRAGHQRGMGLRMHGPLA
jgi:hypothetical protein